MIRAGALGSLLFVVACQPVSLLREDAAIHDANVRDGRIDDSGRPDSAGGADHSVGVDSPRIDHSSLDDRAVGVDHAGVDHTGSIDSGSSTGVDPSQGSGGAIAPGQTGDWAASVGSGHVYVYVPTSYRPAQTAAPVIWLFNEEIDQWRAIADANAIVLVDLDEYNDSSAYVQKINAAATQLEAQYNVDRARYHLAGWSAGGNLVVMLGSQNQDFAASTMVFPGTGGQTAYDELAAWNGHKIRLYYACGDQDPNFSWSAVANEASVFAGLGYTTRFDRVEGCSHYIDESTYHKRSDAWTWVAGFDLRN